MSNRSSHYIVCIHGIAADQSIFGELKPALLKVLSSSSPEVDYKILFYNYETGSDLLSTKNFAEGLQTFLEEEISETPLLKNDKLSIIGHSQGGLIAYIWLFMTALSDKSKHAKFFGHMDSLITLATPFWGTKSAEMAQGLRDLWDKTGKKFFLPAGKNEIKDMSFLSDTVFDFREFFCSQKYEEHRSQISKQVRLLNIAAFSKMLGGLNLVVGDGIFEGDTAVPLPSARADFICTRDIINDYEDGHQTKISKTYKTQLAPYFLVNAVHHTIIPKGEYIPGVVQFPADCIDRPKGSHPSYEYVWKHLLGKQLKQLDKQVLKNLYYFLLDINIRFDSETPEDLTDVKLKFLTRNGESLPWHSVKLGRILDHAPDSKVVSKGHLRYNYSGFTRTTDGPTEFLLIISAPGYRTRFVESYVTPTTSTYIDINLMKC